MDRTDNMPVIRQAREDDIPHLPALLKLLFSIEQDFTFDKAKQCKGLHMLINDEQSCVLAAEQDGSIVGMCTGQLIVSTAEGGPALLVEDVVVREEWRTKGIGRRLMDTLSEWARLKGATRLQLLADRSNRKALGFYMNTGWRSTQLICLRKHT